MDTSEPDEPYPGYWDDVSAAMDEPYTPRDPVSCVTDVATLLAVHTAEQYASVAALRRDARRRESTDPTRGDRALGAALCEDMSDRSIRLELAAALRITEYAAGDLMHRSTTLVERFPQAWDALAGARITDQHARIIVDLLGTIDEGLADQVIDDAVALAEQHPTGTFRRHLRKLIDTLTAPTLTERHETALTQRRVSIDTAGDGMAYLNAYLPAVEAHAIFDRLTRMSKTLTGRTAHADADAGADSADDDHAGTTEKDTRTLDQARADILCDLLIDGTCTGHPTGTSGIRATVIVTVPALTLLDDTHAATHPATIEGLGPIPTGRARELCGGSARWMRILTHPETGIVLSVGRTRYDPPPELRKLTQWRADRCMAPGCTIPATRCEIDHTLAWEHGGHTALTNHAPLCTGHHHVKHHGGWTVTQQPGTGGALHWTSPYGRHYTVEPERRLPAFTPQPDTEPAPF